MSKQIDAEALEALYFNLSEAWRKQGIGSGSHVAAALAIVAEVRNLPDAPAAPTRPAADLLASLTPEIVDLLAKAMEASAEEAQSDEAYIASDGDRDSPEGERWVRAEHARELAWKVLRDVTYRTAHALARKEAGK